MSDQADEVCLCAFAGYSGTIGGPAQKRGDAVPEVNKGGEVTCIDEVYSSEQGPVEQSELVSAFSSMG